jgi:hypothetical protein
MKYLLMMTAALLFSQAAFAKSKPFDGFSAYLLGQPDTAAAFTNQAPQGECAVAGLVETADGDVLCGTRVVRGKTPWLFCFGAKDRAIRNESLLPLASIIPGESCIAGLVLTADSSVIGATSFLMDMDYQHPEDIAARNYPGSHLFRARVTGGRVRVKDLGVPFKGETITAMAADRDKSVIFGITAPSQILFSVEARTGKSQELGRLPSLEVEMHRYIGKSTRAMIVDDSGNVWGSAYGGKLFKYDARTRKADTLSAGLPTEWGAEGQAYDCITALVRAKSGRIFGGTFLDGKLFELFPKTGRVRDLGITSRTGNITGLAEKDGVLYGLTGSQSSYSQLFAYNLATAEMVKYPDVKVYFEHTNKKFMYRPCHLRGLLLLRNGTLAMGEDDSNGHFYTYEPQPVDWAK